MHQQPAPAGRSQRQEARGKRPEAKPEPRTAKDPGTTVTLGMSRQVKLQTTNDRNAVVQFQQSRGFGHQFTLYVQHRCSSSSLTHRDAEPWHSPRRSTAPALPSAETGWRICPAYRNNQLRSRPAGAA